MANIGTLNVEIKMDTRELDKALRRTSFFVWTFNQCMAKLKRESRPLYRLRKWFLSLRWVNNWLWRRGNKTNPVDYNDKWVNPRQNGFTTDSTFGHWYDHVVYGQKQNTAILPDYTSIRRVG